MEFRVPRNSAEGKIGVSEGGKQRKMLGAARHSCHYPDAKVEEQAAKSRGEK